MFDETSRYANLPVAEFPLPDGRRIRYAQWRFLPQAGDLPDVTEVGTAPADRLDLLASRALGDPGQYWRICDANDTMNPAQTLAPPGRRLRIPLTGPAR